MKRTLVLLTLSLATAAFAETAPSPDDLCPLPTMSREKYPPKCLANFDSRIFTMLRTAVSQQRNCYFDANGTLRSQSEADRCLAAITNVHCGPQVVVSLRELESCHASPKRSGS